MKTKLITYATEEYKQHANILHQFSKHHVLFDDQQCFDDQWLKNSLFYEKNKWIFDNVQKGAGNCLWKPYLILKELEKINEGDAIIYMDSQDRIKIEYIEVFKKLLKNELINKNYCLAQGPYPTISYTKYDCFHFMNCLESKYFLSNQLEAGFIAFVKNNTILKFVREWLGYCLHPLILLDCQSTMNIDDKCFKDHRNEQAILTLLSIKYDLKSSREIYNLLDFNVGETPSTHYNITNKRIKNYFE